MESSTYQILIDSSYDELPNEAKQYVNCLVSKASKKNASSRILKAFLKGFNRGAVKADDDSIASLLSGAFIDVDLREAGCLWYFRANIFLFVFSLLTGVATPKLLKDNFCLFLQSLVIASNFVVEGYVNEPPCYWDYE